jgi:hypothetical protein
VRPVGRFLRKLSGAVVLGVAAIFVPKARADDHWSTSPVVDADEVRPGDADGGRRLR